MKRTILIIGVLLITTSVSVAQTKFDKLSKAYKLRSQKILKEFFEEWQNASKPISDSEFAQLDDTIKESYQLFNTVFKETVATQLNNKTSSLSGNDLKLCVVQNKLFIKKWPKVYYTEDEIDSFMVNQIENYPNLKDSTKFKFLRRTNGKLSLILYDNFSPHAVYNSSYLIERVTDFRPKIPNADVLYLNEEYERGIWSFFLLPYNPKYKDKPIDKKFINRLNRKKRFLEKHISFLWDDLFEFRTMPYISSIVFDEKLEYAKVNFESYGFEPQYYKKEAGNWILIPSVSEYSY